MRQLKDSGIEWIKDIPASWNVSRGKNILSLKKRSPEGYSSKDVITCFRDGEVTLRCNRREDGYTFSDKEIGYQGINCGDLVIHGMDGFAGAIGVSDSDGKGSPVLVVCDSNENKRFLMYYLRVLAQQDVFLKLATGIRERSCDLRWNKIADLQFLIPPKEEQDRMVEYIDSVCSRIDSLIVKQEEIIATLKEYKLSVITEAVTKGLDSNVVLKDSGIDWIGMIPAHWGMAKVNRVTSKIGSGKTPKGGSEIYPDEGVLFLRSQNIYNEGLNIDNPTYITEEMNDEMRNTCVLPGDVLLNITGGSIGRCCVFPDSVDRANVNQHVSIIRVIDSLCTSEYMHYYWISEKGRTAINLYQTGGNREGMSADAIGNSPIPIPPIDEQNLITNSVDKSINCIDRIITVYQNINDKLNEYKKALVYEVVIGKKEV